MTSRILHGEESRSTAYTSADFGPHVGYVFLATAVIVLVGTFVDLGILWIGQRQATAQWEFVATTNTLDAFTRLALGMAAAWGAAFFLRGRRLWVYRMGGIAMILMGVAAAFLGFLAVTDYLTLRTVVNEEARRLFGSAALKAAAQSGLYTVTLVPAGLLSLRRPRR